MSKRVLVTGATGFLGSHLCPALTRRGDEVYTLFRTMHRQTLFRAEQTAILGDAQDQSFVQRVLSEYEIDAVVHLAAQAQVSVGMGSPETVIRENINGTLSVLEAARLVGTKRVVIASTDKVYGELPDNENGYREWMPLNERTPYGVSKACGDMLAQTYERAFGMSVAITRCGNLYGPGHMNFSTLIPGTIRRVHRGESPTVRGRATRDFLYIKDAVDAYLTLIDSFDHGAFNFSGGEPRNILEIVEFIIALMSPYYPDPGIQKLDQTGAGEIKSQALNCRLAKDVLGWTPKIPLAEGLKETVAWYMNYLKTGQSLLDSCLSAMKTGFSALPSVRP